LWWWAGGPGDALVIGSVSRAKGIGSRVEEQPMADYSDYYVSRAPRLLRQFDRHFKRVHARLVERYGNGFAEEVRADTRRRFAAILPELPYIGGRSNDYTAVIVINGWIVSLLRAMKARGKSVEEVVGVCCAAADDFFGSAPGFVLRLAGKLAFSGLVRRHLAKQAERSQQRRFAEDFVYEFKSGDSSGDDMALVFSECAVNKFYKAQGAEELAPYCNFFDVTYSRLMGMGVDAHNTIGRGCENCTLAFKRGATTEIPEPLRGIMPR